MQDHRRAVDDSFGYWLAGFIDGEGCFTMQRHHAQTYTCRFSLCLRLDELDTLEDVHERTGIGRIQIRRYKSLVGQHQGQWDVYTKPDCLGLVGLLDRYPLRAKKARDYEVWREGVLLWTTHVADGKAARAGLWQEMAALSLRLRETRRYAPPDPQTAFDA